MTNWEQEDIRAVAELPYDWARLSGKTLMISGGTGFIGSFLIDVLRYRNARYHQNIRVVSLSRRGGRSDGTVTCLAADITAPIVYDGPVDYMLHLASNTHPQQYADDPVGTITTNVLGCQQLLHFAAEHGAKRFLLASSVEIYGQGTPEPVDERYSGYIDCNQARSGYNEAKRTCEALCQAYRQQYGIEAVIARLSRVFGADKKQDTKALSQFMGKAVAGEDIVLKSRGAQRYSYCYVADAASALLFLLLDGADGEAYNVADADDGSTLGGLAERIAALAGTQVVYQIAEDAAASRATYALLSTDKIARLGWRPLYTVADGLARTFAIYRERSAAQPEG